MDEKEYLAGPLGVEYNGNYVSKEEIADLFIEFGGSFVQSLWESLYRADMINTQILLECFKFYVTDYLDRFYEKTNENPKEVIIASAIQFGKKIVPGRRHGDALFVAAKVYGLKRWENYTQWFITNHGRFMNRQYACKFAKENGQLPGNIHKSILYSEDLRDNKRDLREKHF